MEIHVYHGGEKPRDKYRFKEDLQWLNITKDSIWNTGREREINSSLTQTESKLFREGQRKETKTQTRFWRLRPDDIECCPPTETKSGTFCILEFKRMSDVTDQYLIRVRFQGENQYESLWRTLGETLQHQGWCVDQISLNEEDLRENLKFFQVPESSIEAIGSKLDMWIFDEYVNILRYMYHRHWVLDLMEVPPGPDLLPKTHRPPRPPPPPSLDPLKLDALIN